MAIDPELVRWASETEIDPITGLANKSVVPTELKSSGVKANQPLPRQWFNKHLENIHTTFNNIQQQIDAINGASTVPVLAEIMRIGYILKTTEEGNPATYYGFGTWELIAEGRHLVGVDISDPDFDTVLKTGGSKDHTHNDNLTVNGHALTIAEMPEHNHDVTYIRGNNNAGEFVEAADSSGITYQNTTENTGGGTAHSHGLSGGVQSSSNLSPYQCAYFWHRIA